MKNEIQYKYADSSEKAKAFIVGTIGKPNPLGYKKRLIPLNKLRIGESLFFHVDEMIYGDVMRARELMNRLNKHFNDMFVLVKHDEPKKIVEIVRIK